MCRYTLACRQPVIPPCGDYLLGSLKTGRRAVDARNSLALIPDNAKSFRFPCRLLMDKMDRNLLDSRDQNSEVYISAIG